MISGKQSTILAWVNIKERDLNQRNSDTIRSITSLKMDRPINKVLSHRCHRKLCVEVGHIICAVKPVNTIPRETDARRFLKNVGSDI